MFLWGAIIASGWWGFGILKYHDQLNQDCPDWFFIPMVLIIVGSMLTAGVLLYDIVRTIVKCWND